MSLASPFAIVQAWQEAANQQNAARLAELSAPDIEIVGPRGSGYGVQLLQDWLGRAGLQLTAIRAFARDERVVIAQHGVWRSLETGVVTGERDVATFFRVRDQVVTRLARYDSLDTALAEAGLQYADAIQRSGE